MAKAVIKSEPQEKKVFRAPLPRKVKPMIPVMGRQSPDPKNWIFEKDIDGLRALAEVDGSTSFSLFEITNFFWR